jgi:YbbR domain-containing protein
MQNRRTLYFLQIKKYLRVFFTRNIAIKITAFVISLALWMTISTSYDVDMIKRVPLNYITSADTVVSADVLRDVEVRLVGTRTFLHKILKKNKIINIDLRNRKVGPFTYRLHPDLLKIPAGARITGFYPSEVAGRLEKTKTKVLKIVPSFAGEIPYGYKIKNINIEPKELEVTGPESLLAKTDEVYTEVINLNHVYEPMTRSIGIERKYREQFKTVSVDTFSILIDVVPYIVSKTFADIDIMVLGSKDYTMDINKVQVAVQGPKVIMDKIGSKDINAFIDLSFNTPGTHKEKITVKVPQQIELISVKPSDIKVIIKENVK